MNDAIIDSSVVAKWLLPEPDSGLALQLLSDAAQSRSRLVILDLALIEVANAIWRRHRAGLLGLADALQLLDELNRIPVEIETASLLLKPAFAIASKYDRSIYDALFVAACESLKCDGVTADQPLFHAIEAAYPRIRLLGDWPAKTA